MLLSCHIGILSYCYPVILVSCLSYTKFLSSSSWPAPLTSVSATSLPSIPVCAFTHPKWIYQYYFVRFRTLFRISSISTLCIVLFFRESSVTLLSVDMATVLLVWSARESNCSKDFRIAICSAWLFEQWFCRLHLHFITSLLSVYIATPAPTLSPILLPSVKMSVG